MELPTYQGYVIEEADTHYTVISERDKKFHVLQKKEGKIQDGCIVMPDGHVCNINEIKITGNKLFSACREYVYDTNRKRIYHKRKYQEKKAQKADAGLSPSQ